MPPQFADRFTLLREIVRADATGAGVWIVREARVGATWLLKVARTLTRPEVLAQLSRKEKRAVLLAPTEQGALNANQGYELTLLPVDDVRDLAATPASETQDWSQHGHQVVAQLTEALTALHDRSGGAWILHGDVKPANVVWYREPAGALQFALTDFDAAVLVGVPGQGAARLTRLTPAYAAPEVLAGGQLTEKADYWSLGMLVLQQLLGHHPLESLSVELQRSAIAGAWQPDTSLIAAADWRALLGGLLQREAEIRWGAPEIARWLTGEPAMISLGLSLAGESASSVPFFVAGHPVYSAESLARQLVREWCAVIRTSADQAAQPNARTVEAEALQRWLRNDLARPDVEGLLVRLLDDEALSPGLRLLNLARELWPAMPAVWNGRALDVAGLDSAAAAALSGSDEDLQWLREVRDSGALSFYERQGYNEVAATARAWAEAQQRYATAWEALLQLGAPAQARPAPEQELALVTRMAFSEDFQAALRGQAVLLLDPVDWMSRQPWFLHFGSDAARMDVEQIAVLQQLDRPSRQQVVSVDNFSALSTLAPAEAQRCLVIARGEQHRLRKMLVAPGASSIELLPGSVFVPRPRPALLAETWTAIRTWVQRQRDWIRRSRNATEAVNLEGRTVASAADTTSQGAGGVPLGLQVRLTELSVPASPSILGSMTMYAMRVAWQAPSGSELTIRIRRLSWPRADKLRLRQLPVQGQIGLMVSEACRLDLVCRTGPLTWQRTMPIDLNLPAAPPVFAAEQRLTGVSQLTKSRARIVLSRAAPSRQLGPAPRMLTPDSVLLKAADSMILGNARNMLSADSHLLRPTQLAHWSELPVPRRTPEVDRTTPNPSIQPGQTGSESLN